MGAKNTTIAKSAGDVNRILKVFLSNIRKCNVIGLSTECSLVPVSRGKKERKVAVLELCNGEECLIVQLLHIDNIPISLFNFLSLSNFIFVGFGIEKDVSKLEQDYGLVCRNALDIWKLPAQLDVRAGGHSAWRKKDIPRTLSKMSSSSVLLSAASDDWGRANLTENQIRVANDTTWNNFTAGCTLFGIKKHSDDESCQLM